MRTKPMNLGILGVFFFLILFAAIIIVPIITAIIMFITYKWKAFLNKYFLLMLLIYIFALYMTYCAPRSKYGHY